MNDQRELFPNPPADASEARFRTFHETNPGVYFSLRARALELKRRGWKHYGMKALFEVVRYHEALSTTEIKWKLNNNYTAYFARLLMAQTPELEGFFETRSSRADG